MLSNGLDKGLTSQLKGGHCVRGGKIIYKSVMVLVNYSNFWYLLADCLKRLKEIFPNKSEDDLLVSFRENNMDLDETVEVLVLHDSEQGEHVFFGDNMFIRRWYTSVFP